MANISFNKKDLANVTQYIDYLEKQYPQDPKNPTDYYVKAGDTPMTEREKVLFGKAKDTLYKLVESYNHNLRSQEIGISPDDSDGQKVKAAALLRIDDLRATINQYRQGGTDTRTISELTVDEFKQVVRSVLKER